MFQSTAKRFRTLLSRIDDILADHPDEAGARAREAQLQAEIFASTPFPHPHRRPLRSRRVRRLGVVPAAPAHCTSPVRAKSADRGMRTAQPR